MPSSDREFRHRSVAAGAAFRRTPAARAVRPHPLVPEEVPVLRFQFARAARVKFPNRAMSMRCSPISSSRCLRSGGAACTPFFLAAARPACSLRNRSTGYWPACARASRWRRTPKSRSRPTRARSSGHALPASRRQASTGCRSACRASSRDSSMRSAACTTPDEARAAAAAAIEIFGNVNLDLMYALPGQTLADAKSDLAEALRFSPPHLSFYHLTIEPNTLFHRYPPALAGRRDGRGHRGCDRGSARRRRLPALRNVGLRQAGSRMPAQRQLLALRRLSGHRRRRPFQAVVSSSASCARSGTSSRSSISRKPSADRRSLEDRTVERNEIGFEFMLNALRLTEGVPVALFAERTGFPLTLVQKPLDEAERRGLDSTRSPAHSADAAGPAFSQRPPGDFPAGRATAPPKPQPARSSSCAPNHDARAVCADARRSDRRAFQPRAFLHGTHAVAARSHRRHRRQRPGMGMARSRAGARRGARAGRAAHLGRRVDARRRPDRRQGHRRHRRHADADGIADLRRCDTRARRRMHRPPPPCGRHGHGQDGDDRIRVHATGQDAESVACRLHAGRLLVGFGGGGRARPGARRNRHADQRLSNPAGGILRHRWIQAGQRPAAIRRRPSLQPDAGYAGRFRAHGRRLRVARRRARRRGRDRAGR